MNILSTALPASSMRRLLAAALAGALALAATAAAHASSAPAGNPRLASLRLDIWPEYDRPAALVLMHGRIADSARLPAVVTLRLPAASGGPTAVAYAIGSDDKLYNLEYRTERAGDYVTLAFSAPQREFHVEFYEPLATAASERRYAYLWPGDLAVDEVELRVQEPAGARNLDVRPALDASAPGADSLFYRRGLLGALAPGKALPVEISYVKADDRTTREILAAQRGDVPPPAARGFLADVPDGLLIALALVVGTSAGGVLWLTRKPAAAAGGRRACPKCGRKARGADRYCARCGTAIR